MDVTAEGVAGELLGGRLSADLTMRRSPDGLGLQGWVGITDADATQLLFGDGTAPLTGQAALTLQFEGLGRSPRALVGSLNGTGTLTLDQMRVASLHPNVFASAMRSVDQGLPIDAPRVRDVANRGLDAGPLVVPHAEATLTIAAGVARIDTFKARAEAADLAVTGSYDFSDARIDVRLAMAGPAAGTSLQPEIAVQLRGPVSAPERVLDISALTGWLALRSVDRQTKKLEAIEQGRPAEAVSPPEQREPIPQREAPAAAPRSDLPAAPPRRSPPQAASEPLPPPVAIRPAASERRRILPQQHRPDPHRAEPQRAETQRPAGANPFPAPIGTPPPPRVLQPLPPQTVRPAF
ncbi:MAG: hypothetical protein IT520_12750, partial [Burkholderiales bacterium]|nr:hypothetical protein [Burkholderiales bacterium]